MSRRPTFKSYGFNIVFLVMCTIGTANGESLDGADSPAQHIIDIYGQDVFTVTASRKVKCDNDNASINEKPGYKICQNIGTAFFFDKNGYLITLNSVTRDAEEVFVVSSTGKKVKASVLGCDNSGTISVLKIKPWLFTHTPAAFSCGNLDAGEDVYLLGKGYGEDFVVKEGSISGIKHHDGTFIIEVAGNPGTSGTPLFDNNSNVLGFLAYHIDDEEYTARRIEKTPHNSISHLNSYVAIQSGYAFVIARYIINKIEGKCGWLGIIGSDDTDSLSNSRGVVITRVVEGSPADRYGLKKDDIIIEFNAKSLDSTVHLIQEISSTKAGDTVPLKILRGNKTLTVSIVLSPCPSLR